MYILYNNTDIMIIWLLISSSSYQGEKERERIFVLTLLQCKTQIIIIKNKYNIIFNDNW